MKTVMEDRTWTFVDKTPFGEGPWQNEPDKMQFIDVATGLPCLIVRQKYSGHLCGYVGVSHDHPLYEKSGDELTVHGGVSFTGKCSGDEHGICHVVTPGEPDDVWWFGFDHAHSGDLQPRYPKDYPEETYKDIEYVKEQCTILAKQLREMQT